MRRVIDGYRYFADRRFSTLAGTLVYFLLMSVTPFLFWLAILVGEVDFSRLTSNEFFSAVAPILTYLQEAAQEATGSAGVILLTTSLWSSTNFFYHLRRSGEIIYGSRFVKGGFSLRISALFAVLLTILLVAFVAAVPFLSLTVLSEIMPLFVAQIISVAFLTMAAFFIAYLLNVFACPYKLDFDTAINGVLLTVILWILCAAGFTVYLRFANPQKLYGAIAAVIVFLLWCYIMVNSLVVGMIYTSRFLPRRRILKGRSGSYSEIM